RQALSGGRVIDAALAAWVGVARPRGGRRSGIAHRQGRVHRRGGWIAAPGRCRHALPARRYARSGRDRPPGPRAARVVRGPPRTTLIREWGTSSPREHLKRHDRRLVREEGK